MLIAEVHSAICMNVFCTMAAERGSLMAYFLSSIALSLGVELKKDQVTMDMK